MPSMTLVIRRFSIVAAWRDRVGGSHDGDRTGRLERFENVVVDRHRMVSTLGVVAMRWAGLRPARAYNFSIAPGGEWR
jgi:hypothetical protein